MNYKEIAVELKEAKALIHSPERWTTRYYGRDANRNCVSSTFWDTNPPASMCSIGAIHMVQRTKEGQQVAMARAKFGESAMLLRQFAGGAIEHYNDNHTHEEVMALWDKAIAKAEELAKGEQK